MVSVDSVNFVLNSEEGRGMTSISSVGMVILRNTEGGFQLGEEWLVPPNISGVKVVHLAQGSSVGVDGSVRSTAIKDAWIVRRRSPERLVVPEWSTRESKSTAEPWGASKMCWLGW